MNNKQLLACTREEIRHHFNYDQSTGVFTWRNPRSNNAKIGAVAGAKHNKGYWQMCLKGKHYLGHQLAFMYVLGWCPIEIDHINRDKSDNRWINIRPATHSENMKNKPMQKNNTSGHTGIYVDKSTGRWRVEISSNKKKFTVGFYADISDAIKARKKAEIEHGFHPNHGGCSNVKYARSQPQS